MKPSKLFILLTLCLLSGCYVTHPPYTTTENVMKLELGMHKDSVNSILEMEANDLGAICDSSYTLIYKYRLKEVKRIPRTTHRTKGIEAEGQFKNLYLTFDTTDILTELKTDEELHPSTYKETKIDFVKILNVTIEFITVTLPAAVVYLSLN